MSASIPEALAADFAACPDPIVRLAGMARLSRRRVIRGDAAAAALKEAVSAGIAATVVDAAAGLVLNGASEGDAAFRMALEQSVPLPEAGAFADLGSLLEHVAEDTRELYWKHAARGAPREALQRLVRIARAVQPEQRPHLRSIVSGLNLGVLSTEFALLVVKIAGAYGQPDFPGSQGAIDTVLESARRAGDARRVEIPFKDIVTVAGITSAHATAFLAARADLPDRIRELVTGGKPEADFIGLFLLSIALDRDDDALQKLFERAWGLRSDDERRRALVACLRAAARSSKVERFVDDVIVGIAQPGHGPYFRTEIAEAITTALEKSAPSVAGPRVSMTASIFMEMFPNTSGDVSFAYAAVARLADRVFDFSSADGTSLATALLPLLDAPSTTHWTPFYRSVSRLIIGDIVYRSGDRSRGTALFEEALGIDGRNGFDLADVLREAVHRTPSRKADKEWTRFLLESISRIGPLPLRAAAARTLVDARLEPLIDL